MTDTLERAISRFRHRPAPAPDIAGRVSAAAFRAMALERLRSVERDVTELRTRATASSSSSSAQSSHNSF